jgi:hypothetical protein
MNLKRTALFFVLLFSAMIGFAQIDELVLDCPLANGAPKTIRASDRDYQFTSEDGVVFVSKTDSIVLAIHTGLVLSVERADDKTYDMIVGFKDYYFVYSGILSPTVKRFSKLKPGDIVGTYKPGALLELTVYLIDKPISPAMVRKYMKCK